MALNHHQQSGSREIRRSFIDVVLFTRWIPACAGMTEVAVAKYPAQE
ncbi:MAG: hypothetical protein JWP89_6743 [Schlesneria sp.]|nr:hypothetical protein [Schlesneria sp.]